MKIIGKKFEKRYKLTLQNVMSKTIIPERKLEAELVVFSCTRPAFYQTYIETLKARWIYKYNSQKFALDASNLKGKCILFHGGFPKRYERYLVLDVEEIKKPVGTVMSNSSKEKIKYKGYFTISKCQIFRPRRDGNNVSE